MKRKFDLIAIGSGSAASTVAYQCRSAGWEVAMVDSRPFGGTCALRGCDPKKVLVAAGEAFDWVARMKGRGFHAEGIRIDWPELMHFKRTFTDPVPQNREQRLAKAGIHAFHQRARFVDSASLEVGGEVLDARYILIATGAGPRKLSIIGEQYITSSDQFLELPQLPRRIIFIGGGYISFEFAHVAARTGSEVIILHRGERALKGFDPDLVGRLVRKTKELGAEVRLGTQVNAIERAGESLRVHTSANGSDQIFDTDLVVHGAGREPEIGDLNLAAGAVEANRHGIVVNEFLQSVSNPAVYAAGDAASTGLPALTPVAGYEGRIVASNLINGNLRKRESIQVPTAVFTIPQLAGVGMTEDIAKQRNLQFRVHREDTANWYSSRRTGEDCSGFKVLIEENTDRILGAHLIGTQAGEMINLFALAIRANMSSAELKGVQMAYPTHASDLVYMV